jgi:hypothetical protein
MFQQYQQARIQEFFPGGLVPTLSEIIPPSIFFLTLHNSSSKKNKKQNKTKQKKKTKTKTKKKKTNKQTNKQTKKERKNFSNFHFVGERCVCKAYDRRSGRDLYRATPAVTRSIGFPGLIIQSLFTTHKGMASC